MYHRVYHRQPLEKHRTKDACKSLYGEFYLQMGSKATSTELIQADNDNNNNNVQVTDNTNYDRYVFVSLLKVASLATNQYSE